MTNDVEVDVDVTYTFTIAEKVDKEYLVANAIIAWLQENLTKLKDDNLDKVFSKVNCGFSEESLKHFGKKPVCDVYINNVEYDSEFNVRHPIKAHTIVLFYMKGANNNTYMKACELHDYLMQEFITNETFRRLTDVVRETRITTSEVRNQALSGKYGVVGAFELSHDLY